MENNMVTLRPKLREHLSLGRISRILTREIEKIEVIFKELTNLLISLTKSLFVQI